MPSENYTLQSRDIQEDTMYNQPENLDVSQTSGFRFGHRHLQCFMAFLAIACAFCHRIGLSVAIVSMTQKSDHHEDVPVLPWDGPMKGTILSSFFWSYLILQIPGGRLAEKFGPKILIVTAVSISSVVMILTPFAAIYGGFYWMIFTRVFTGLIQGVILPSTNFLLAKWVPITERGLLLHFVLCGADFGIMVTLATAGTLADSRWGWPSVFYVSGGITLLWALSFAYVGANSPNDHSTISEREKTYILNRLPNTSLERKDFKTPWRDMVTSVPFLALVCAYMAENWGYYTLLTQIPSYMNAALGLDIKRSGFLSALPYLSTIFSGFVYALINDWLNNNEILSRTALRKLWNSIAHYGGAVALCSMAFAGESPAWALTFLITAVTLNSAKHCSIFSNHLDLAPNFAGTLMGITLAFGTLSSLSTPLYAGFIVNDKKSLFEWRIVFLTAAAIFFVGNTIFLVFGSGNVQSWNFPKKTSKELTPDGTILTDQLLKGKKSENHAAKCERGNSKR